MADMVKATVTAEKQRELYIAQQEAEIAAETKKVELAERQADVRERELNATVKKQAEADRYAAEQAAEADLYKRTKQARPAVSSARTNRMPHCIPPRRTRRASRRRLPPRPRPRD